jgi:hypothetical protein
MSKKRQSIKYDIQRISGKHGIKLYFSPLVEELRTDSSGYEETAIPKPIEIMNG